MTRPFLKWAGGRIITYDVHRNVSRDGVKRHAVRQLLACWLPNGEPPPAALADSPEAT